MGVAIVCRDHTWVFLLSGKNEKVLVPLREQGQKRHFCGTTLFAGNPTASLRRQHAACPLTLAMRQKILGANPFPPALRGPFAAPLFAPLSAMQNSLWMRLAALLPLRWFQFMLCHLYIICVRLSRTFFRVARTFSSILPYHGLDDADDLRVGAGGQIWVYPHRLVQPV